jgi:exodeoxyribonuclease VII large subunit
MVDMPETANARVNLPELSVSELSLALKRTIEDAYGYVRVRGELGNVKYHSSGHIYLDLKDDKACLAGIVWRNAAPRIKVKLEAGLEVVVTGRITTFPGQSKYQIVIETLEPAGLGALMALVEERKKKLAAEGLFDAARKKPLPYLPEVIGIVTSATGAVIRDILHRLADRFPRHVLLWPVAVQGEGSAHQIAAAIRGFNALPKKTISEQGALRRPDLLIVARGGGSLEDLWSFNEEIVVRAAAESMIPLISAIGHETDVTLIDFAADRRAPTPTAAAEMAVPVRADLLAEVDSLARRSLVGWRRAQDTRRTELRAAARALPGADDLLALARQRFDHATARLTLQTLNTRIVREREQLTRLAQRSRHCLRVYVERRRDRYTALAQRLTSARVAYANAQRAQLIRTHERVLATRDRARVAIGVLLQQSVARLERAGRLLSAVSYRAVLDRGFALVRDLDGRPLREASAIGPGLAMEIEFTDGRVRAWAEGGPTTVAFAAGGSSTRSGELNRAPANPTPANPTPAKPRRRTRNPDSGQGSLFEP